MGHLQLWPPPPAFSIRASPGGHGDTRPTAGLAELEVPQLIPADTSTAVHSMTQTDTNTPAGYKRLHRHAAQPRV